MTHLLPPLLPQLPEAVAAAVAAAGGLALLALLARAALALAGRTRVQDVLANPRRRALHGFIVAQPGLSFRDLHRLSGWGVGTLVHHLRFLARAGHIVAQPYGHTMRYFENHGRYRHTWRTVAALTDARLEVLHAWLLEHPGTLQRDAVRHARAAWGWGRSATQERLAALVREGLAEARAVGRQVAYAARPRPAEPALGLGLGAPGKRPTEAQPSAA
ncbi:MAG: hypothetical protein LC623_00700 [Halobacteriales archaeon]|nr:hypothetical protein [Halobacteriales archaeon]